MRAMVLNDGETYTDVAGCHIYQLTDGQADAAFDAAVAGGGEKEVFEQQRAVYGFHGDEIIALSPDEFDCVQEALHYLVEWGGKWKDTNGKTVRKGKREKVLDGLAGKGFDL